MSPTKEPKTGCESGRCCLSIFTVCLIVISYVVCGAIAFFFIESHHQEEQPISKPSQVDLDLDSLRNSTVQRLWTLTVELNVFYESNWTQVAELELQKFQDEIMKYISIADYYGSHRKSSNSGNCDDDSFTSFPATILYCLTLITTIGYGTVSPRSLPGRILTVFYACVGIPLTLCYLATVGDFFSKLMRKGYSKLLRKGSTGVPIPISLALLFLYLSGGALIFWWLENWPFVDAIFFCFASLATIGFGGMLDPHSKSISLIASSIYILLGMALISTVFNLVQDEILRRRAGKIYHRPIS